MRDAELACDGGGFYACFESRSHEIGFRYRNRLGQSLALIF
jgi:hypothetical protein